MSQPTKRLGRGLSSLISTNFNAEKPEAIASPQPPQAVTAAINPPTHRPQLISIKLTEIRQNPHQPRKRFDEAALQGLADSLRERGALQPIVVRRAENGFELVTGERRLRAARMADLSEIPAVVRQVSDEEMLELALIENLQRADLNPLERARAYTLLHDKYKLTHEQIAQKMGEDRATVTNFMRLLLLPEPVLGLIDDGMLGAGHARVLLSLKEASVQINLAEKIRRQGWSVRKTETEVARLQRSNAADPPKAVMRKSNIEDLEQQLAAALGTKVSIREGRRRHTGRLVIEYYNLDDFARITQRLGISSE